MARKKAKKKAKKKVKRKSGKAKKAKAKKKPKAKRKVARPARKVKKARKTKTRRKKTARPAKKAKRPKKASKPKKKIARKPKRRIARKPAGPARRKAPSASVRPEPLAPAGGGVLLVFSGPSGAGKSTVAKGLAMADPRIWRSVSMTTRAPREGERDGIDYLFVTQQEFGQIRRAGRLLESATVHGQSYGTPLGPVVERLSQGRDVLLEIDVQGAAQVRSRAGEAALVFLRAPSRAVLEQRLRERRSESEQAIAARLRAADAEIGRVNHYDYLVVNDEVEKAVSEILAIVTAERSRVQRRQNLPW